MVTASALTLSPHPVKWVNRFVDKETAYGRIPREAYPCGSEKWLAEQYIMVCVMTIWDRRWKIDMERSLSAQC
jgi:hypothetical protein